MKIVGMPKRSATAVADRVCPAGILSHDSAASLATCTGTDRFFSRDSFTVPVSGTRAQLMSRAPVFYFLPRVTVR